MSEAPGRNSTYYVMTCEGVYPAAVVRRVTELAGGPWMDGRLITEPVPNPMRFEVRPEYPGVLKPMYEGAVLLMRDDLIDVLRETGVDNLQLSASTSFARFSSIMAMFSCSCDTAIARRPSA